MTIERFDLDAIPLYNADLDADGVRPAEVERLKKAKALEAWTRRVATPEAPAP